MIEQAREQVVKLLTTDWLMSDAEVHNGMFYIRVLRSMAPIRYTLGDRRRRDLARIRQIYIPELIIRLHSILVGSRSRVPEYVHSFYPLIIFHLMRRPSAYRNIKHTLSLVNIVADSRYRLYEDFSNQDGRRLGDYLGAVRQAVLAGLEGGGSEPFRILTV